jgi:hypothetical protein
MNCDINGSVGDSLDLGGVLYTPGVGILRGPLDEGALWYQDPPRADIIWVAVPPRPQLLQQEQYAHERDRNAMARVVDRIFLWAAANGVDILCMPPLGCGAHGCEHPTLDVAEIIYRTAQRYAQYIPQVCIGSDWPPHFEVDGSETNRWWDAFSDAVQNGRPAVIYDNKLLNIPRSPRKKSAKELLEKNRKLSRPKPRTHRMTFL